MTPVGLLLVVACGQDGDSGALQGIEAELVDEVRTVVRVRWHQTFAGPTWLEFQAAGEDWQSTPVLDRLAGVHSEVVLGVPARTDVVYRVVGEREGRAVASADHRATTGAIPASVPVPSLEQHVPDGLDPRPWLLVTLSDWDDGWAYILDRRGRVVWYREMAPNTWTLWALPSQDGTHLLLDEANWVGTGSVVYRITLDGTILETIDTPYLHHPFVELPDGSLVWGASEGRIERLDKRRGRGPVETLWDCADFLVELGTDDTRCTSNSLAWDPVEDRFLLSFFDLDTVAEIDHATGATLRWFGQAPGSYAFEPSDSVFDFQHGVHWTGAGTLLLSTRDAPEGYTETHAREYRVDPSSETLELVWSYGEGQGLYAEEIGDARRLPNGNTLLNYGSNPLIREIDGAGQTVWQVAWDLEGWVWVGRQHLLEDLYAFR